MIGILADFKFQGHRQSILFVCSPTTVGDSDALAHLDVFKLNSHRLCRPEAILGVRAVRFVCASNG